MATTGTDEVRDAQGEVGDAGISLSSVLVMLVILAALVVGIFWILPAWLGSQIIEVTIRN